MLLNLVEWNERQCCVMKRTLEWLSVYLGKELPQPRFLVLGNGESIHSAYLRGCEQQMRKYTVNSNGPLRYALMQCLSHVGPSISFSLTWTFSGLETEMEARLYSPKETCGIFSYKIPNACATGEILCTDFTDSTGTV